MCLTHLLCLILIYPGLSLVLKTQLGMYRFFVQADSAITTDIKKVIAILETLDFKVEMIGAFN